MRAALLIAGKDVRQRIRDRSAILLAFVVPLALAFVLDLVFGGVSQGDVTFAYAVVDEDGGTLADGFSGVLDSLVSEGFITLDIQDSEPAGRDLVESGSVEALFVVPSGFTDAVVSGGTASIMVVGNVDSPTAAAVAGSIARSYTEEINTTRVAAATRAAFGAGDLSQEALGELSAELASIRPVVVEDVSAANRQLDPSSYLSVSMAVFFMFFTVQFGVSSLLDERREGTLSRLLAAPISKSSILGGKLLTSFVLGVISMVMLWIATSLLLGAEWGRPAGVLALIAAGVLSAMAIMALVATLATTAEQAGNWQAIIAVVLGLFGGAFFPVGQGSGIVSRLSLLTPHAWFLRGMGDLQGGGSFVDVLPAVGAMLLFAAVFGSVALTRLDRMARP